ncbi:MAG: magnesium/cobalt transporter CorA [Deltaproteobacteria bacterium]
MPESVSSIAEKAGLSPGVLMHVGEARLENARIEVLSYDQEKCRQLEAGVEDLDRLRQEPGTTWIEVQGVHDLEVIQQLGKALGLHPLLLEDVVNTEHRPKVEDYGEFLFVVLKILHFNREEMSIEPEHVSLVLGDGLVVSFLEADRHPFDPVKKRIMAGRRRIRRLGADYLAYALVDVVVDTYFRLIEELGGLLESAEDRVLAEPQKETLLMLHRLKQVELTLRAAILPLREVIGNLTREDSDLLSEAIGPFLRDVHDHAAHVIEASEAHRETLNTFLELYHHAVNNRLSEVMKVLTIVATIFMPLTFIAGIYGMNFKRMPELDWYFGYPLTLGVMLLLALAMVLFFHRKRWL